MSESCDDPEVYPDGYEEALADCTVFAAQLLKMALKTHRNQKRETGDA
jgi:hypothetical protein